MGVNQIGTKSQGEEKVYTLLFYLNQLFRFIWTTNDWVMSVSSALHTIPDTIHK